MKNNFTNFKNLPLFFICFFLLWGNVHAQIYSEQSQAVGVVHSYQARSLIGGGVAFFDFDNDGDDDLYLVGGTTNQDDLYQNNSDGTFTKITSDIGLNITQEYNTIGVCTGDIDNDGDRDVFLTTWEKYEAGNEPIARNLLFQNNGDETFTEIGEAAGITHAAFGMSASFLDYDQDGFLDIYVANYVETPAFTYDMNGAIDGFAHECFPNFLYKNNGDLTFTEVSANEGVDSDACSSAVLSSDFDQDGDADILLANDFGNWLTPDQLFQNDYPNSSFQEVASSVGIETTDFGIGVAAGDYDNDLDMDYYITSIGRNNLSENESGTFSDVTTAAGVENATTGGLNTTSHGTAFLDVNNDGWEDLFVANGRIPTLAAYATAQDDPDKLFLNNGDKTFTDATDTEGISNTEYSRGMAYSDFDQDGDLDVFVVVLPELGGTSKFYINESSNNGNNFAQIKLEGTASNRDAYGSKVWLYAEGNTYYKELSAGGSYASQHSSLLHFGVGSATQIDSIRIEWTNGLMEVSSTVDINTVNTFVEGFTTSIESPFSAQLQLNLFPNPTTGRIEIKGATADRVEVMDVHGRILQVESTAISAIDISDFPKGIYFLKIKMEERFITKRVIKK